MEVSFLVNWDIFKDLIGTANLHLYSRAWYDGPGAVNYRARNPPRPQRAHTHQLVSTKVHSVRNIGTPEGGRGARGGWEDPEARTQKIVALRAFLILGF